VVDVEKYEIKCINFAFLVQYAVVDIESCSWN
jgi:hypothetical protein